MHHIENFFAQQIYTIASKDSGKRFKVTLKLTSTGEVVNQRELKVHGTSRIAPFTPASGTTFTMEIFYVQHFALISFSSTAFISS